MTSPHALRFASREDLEDAFARHVSPGKVATFRKYGVSVVMGRREGARFWDAFDERPFWNCHCNGGVFNLGHRNPAVVAAVRRGLDDLDVGNHHLVSAARAELASRLSASTGHKLPRVVFGVSGGEAMDVAVKAARAATGRSRLVSIRGGYHGHTGYALALGDEAYRASFGPALAEVAQVPFDDLRALDAELDDHTAAVVVEPVPATLGIAIARAGYFSALAALCRERGVKLIVDEVQTGLGRTGAMWAHEHEAITPDAVVVGKGLSGGVYPITATVMTDELFRVFAENPFIHVSTFGGAELGCMAALAVLDIVEAPAFLPRVRELAARFARGLSGLPFTLRQRGMMMGLALPMAEGGLFAAKALIDAGIFAVYANNDTSVCQLLPPLTLEDAEADAIIAGVRRAFGA